jgi:hypothetical protein
MTDHQGDKRKGVYNIRSPDKVSTNGTRPIKNQSSKLQMPLNKLIFFYFKEAADEALNNMKIIKNKILK